MRMDHPESAPMTLTIHSWLVERESAGFAPSFYSKEASSP